MRERPLKKKKKKVRIKGSREVSKHKREEGEKDYSEESTPPRGTFR